MENMYRLMAKSEECRKRILDILTIIAEHDYEEGSVLWHCTEGKDRCGIISALVLTMLGVSREDIMEDYLITNDVNGPKSAVIYQMLIDEGETEEMAEGISRSFLALESYLNAAFEVMEEESGSLYAYITDCLGMPEAKIEAFREKILV